MKETKVKNDRPEFVVVPMHHEATCGGFTCGDFPATSDGAIPSGEQRQTIAVREFYCGHLYD